MQLNESLPLAVTQANPMFLPVLPVIYNHGVRGHGLTRTHTVQPKGWLGWAQDRVPYCSKHDYYYYYLLSIFIIPHYSYYYSRPVTSSNTPAPLMMSWLLYILGPITSFFSIVTDEDLRNRNVLHFNLFQLLCDCSTIALSLPMP